MAPFTGIVTMELFFQKKKKKDFYIENSPSFFWEGLVLVLSPSFYTK